MSNGIHSGNPWDANDWIVAPNHWGSIQDKGPHEDKLVCPDCVEQWHKDAYDCDCDADGFYQCSGNVWDAGALPEPYPGDKCVVCGRAPHGVNTAVVWNGILTGVEGPHVFVTYLTLHWKGYHTGFGA